MRQLLITILVHPTVFGCGDTPTPKPVVESVSATQHLNDSTDATKEPKLPRFWEDKLASYLISSMPTVSQSETHVFRWENCDLIGSIELLVDDAPVTFDFSVTANAVAANLGTDKIDEISGLLVVRTHKLDVSTRQIWDVQLDGAYEAKFSNAKRSSTVLMTRREGKFFRSASNQDSDNKGLRLLNSSELSSNNGRIESGTWETLDGKERSWLTVGIQELGSTQSKNAEPSDAPQSRSHAF